ncbi:hypothetical protein CspHIS471_0408600 [Cutaneotrichosporon sp. HIS471]|nr:hypothetical protein CspHIS471_0408600 [Cutaneotrichosporon sp. HIS471]
MDDTPDTATLPGDVEKKGLSELERTDDALLEREGDHGIKRDLPPRVVSMIAIAGTIGTGLFLSSGSALTSGGPVGAFLGYTVMGIMVGCMMYCLGEMMCFKPNVGAYIEMGATYVDPAVAFCMSWACMMQSCVCIPAEISAIGLLAGYWDKNTDHLAGYIAAGVVAVALITVIPVRWYGEVEFFFAAVKVTALIGLIIFGPGSSYIGGRYWVHEPFNDTFMNLKPVSKARFLGFWQVMTAAGYSFSGMESLAVVAGEAANPRHTMRVAVRTVFYRVVGLYCLSILILGLSVSQHSPDLLDAVNAGGETAASSPFVVLCRQVNVKVLPDIINAVVLTSAFSSANENAYAVARFTMAMARQGWLPKSIFLYTYNGVPIAGALFASAMGCLAFMSCSEGSNQVFVWFSNLDALSAMVLWILICATYTRFHRALKVQGIDRRNLSFRSWGQPYLAYMCIVFFSLVVLFNGFSSFVNGFKVSNFIASYITLPILFTAWAGYKVVRRSKVVPLDKIDLSGGPAKALIGTAYDK